MSTPKHKLYTVAEGMFIEQGFTCESIAELLGISTTTLVKWRKLKKWDTLREETLVSPEKVRKLLREELERVAKGEKARIDTDALSKLAKTLQYYDGRVALSVVLSVVKELNLWTAENEPEKVVEQMELHKKFLHHRARMDSLKQ